MRKEGLRTHYRQLKSSLSPEAKQQANSQIAQHFFADPRLQRCLSKSGAVVHTYLPIRRQNEVDTWPLIHQLWQAFPHVCIWSSVTETDPPTLRHFRLTPGMPFTETKWGIPVPAETPVYLTGQPNLVVVPLLAFDRQGHRVGYGGGYYDRFLADAGADCLKVGLSFFEPVDVIDNVEATDVRLTDCITPSGIHHFS